MRAYRRRETQRGPMSTPVETTAAMDPTAETTAALSTPGEPDDSPVADQDEAITALGTAGERPGAAPRRARGSRSKRRRSERREREPVSTNVVISVIGGLITTLLAGMITFQVWQFNSLANSIDGLSDRIDQQGYSLGARIDLQGESLGDRIDQQGYSLGARIDAQGAELRAEMRAGFAEINEILLDHTERLTRLETLAGLTIPDN